MSSETTMVYSVFVIWDPHPCDGPGVAPLLAVGCSSPRHSQPSVCRHQLLFGGCSYTELPQEGVSAQDRSSASTSTVEEETTRDLQYSSVLHRALGKEMRGVWEDEPKGPQPI